MPSAIRRTASFAFLAAVAGATVLTPAPATGALGAHTAAHTAVASASTADTAAPDDLTWG